MKYIRRLFSNDGSCPIEARLQQNKISRSHAIRHSLSGILALGLAALLLAGCIEDKMGVGHRPGDKVTFSASSGYDNDTFATKTVYSGAEFTVGSSKWERIDWVNGDLFTVYCAAAQGTLKKADYKVRSHSASNEKSLADIIAPGQSLTWGTGQHVFYAMYPAASTPGVDPSRVSIDGNILKGTIPAAQTVTLKTGTRTYLPDMRYAYMYAATTVPAAGTHGPINLWFKPMMTALEFTVDSGDDPTLSLYSFELSSTAVALTGDFTATVVSAAGPNSVCDYTVPLHTAANSRITVNFGGAANPTVIRKGYPITFMVFALPHNLTGLTVKFVTSKGNRTIPLNYSAGAGGGPVTFNSCRKSKIATLGVPGRLYDFYINVTAPNAVPYSGGTASATLRSYKENRFTGAQTAVPWQVAGYYADAACTVPYNGTDATQKPAWLASITENGTGTAALSGQPITAQLLTQTALQTIPNAQTTLLRAKSEIGTQTAPVDLSMLRLPYDPESPAATRSTANCYVVTRPGWYCFPLVYGNAIKDGAQNTAAYASSQAPYYNWALGRFLRHDGSGIVGPWISGDNGLNVASAQIVWQDWPSLVESISVNGAFIHFHIRQDNIHEGNAVIAAKDASGTILWSWHIWVTAQTMTTIPIQNGWSYYGQPAGGQDWFNFLSENVGSCYDGDGYGYPAREVHVRLSNEEQATAIRILQTSQMFQATGYNCTFYQWGRKDPMLPTAGKTNNNKIWYNADGVPSAADFPSAYWFGGSPASNASVEIANTIKNPGTRNSYEKMDYHYQNLWGAYHPDYPNANHWSSWNLAAFSPLTKTVYDPSPVGFVLPPSSAFTGFLTRFDTWSNNPADFNVSGNWDGGWNFHTGIRRTGKTVFFPTTGGRRSDTGTPVGLTTIDFGLYWTGGPFSFGTEWHLFFHASHVYPGDSRYFERGTAMAVRPVAE